MVELKVRLCFRRVLPRGGGRGGADAAAAEQLWEGCEKNPRQSERGATKMFINSGGIIIKFA